MVYFQVQKVLGALFPSQLVLKYGHTTPASNAEGRATSHPLISDELPSPKFCCRIVVRNTIQVFNVVL